MGTTHLIGELCRAVLRYWKPEIKRAMGDDTHRLSSISQVGTHKECRRDRAWCSGLSDVVGSILDCNVRETDLSQCQGLATGAREFPRIRWVRRCECEACCDLAIFAGRERPRSCYRTRNRHFVLGVRTVPTTIHTVESGGDEGARFVTDVLVVAQACLFPAHLNVVSHKCGGDRPDKVWTCCPGNTSGEEHRRNYHQDDSKLTIGYPFQGSLLCFDGWLSVFLSGFL